MKKRKKQPKKENVVVAPFVPIGPQTSLEELVRFFNYKIKRIEFDENNYTASIYFTQTVKICGKPPVKKEIENCFHIPARELKAVAILPEELNKNKKKK